MEKILNEGEQYSSYAMDFMMEYGLRLLGGILFLIIGLWIVGIITRAATKMMTKRSFDPSLIPFLKTLISITLKVLVVISVMSMIGIQMTSFIAILGAAGLAIGLALSGTLQNFAGGVIILILRPYKVGDVIEVQGFIGTVHEIQIFNTILKTWDNRTIIIPNAQLSNNSIINYTTEPERKVQWEFGISYADDIDKAKSIIEKTVFTDERVLDKEGEYYINVSALADSSVVIRVRATVKGEDYWQFLFDITERVKKAFDKEGITIPFPQRDVHMHQQN